MMSKLAIMGGRAVRTTPFPPYNVIGEEEKTAACRVLDSGMLSKFLGAWDPDFYGGPEVRALEEEWAAHFRSKHAVAMNSATSAIYAAVGALGIEPRDEVIVSPYTMSASAVAPLIYGAIPVFADVEREHFCIDPASMEERITDRTSAVIIVDLFGQPYDVEAINEIARRHGLKVIEDAAQAPGAMHDNRHAGTLGDIGVYSLNYHKHVHCGEGGIAVTEDDEVAERLRLIRNHAESVVEGHGTDNLQNMVGFNYRMTEIEATIARCQLRRLPGLVRERQDNVAYLSSRLREIPGITPAPVRSNCTHAYYLHPLIFDANEAETSRDAFVRAVRAELPPTTMREAEGALISPGYLKPLYMLPLFQNRIAFGSDGHPFASGLNVESMDYNPGRCPTVERIEERELILHDLMKPGMSSRDLDDVADAFEKVWTYRHELKAGGDG